MTGVFKTGVGFGREGLRVVLTGIEVNVIFKTLDLGLSREILPDHLKFIPKRSPCIPRASTPAVSICFMGVAQLLPGVKFDGYLQS